MYLIKDKYPEIVDFVINDNILMVEKNENKKKDVKYLKNLILHVLEKIHEKINPQVVFSNILGLFDYLVR